MVSGRFRGKKVGVLMGGISSEREVSLMSGQAVCQALQEREYTVVPIRVEADLAWLTQVREVDVVFIALHGKFGEDGSIQGLLEIFAVPYTGSGVLASALGMNKVLAKQIWRSHDLPTPRWQVFHQGVPQALSLPSPLVVKPNNEGSSVGVSIVRSPEVLESALAEAFRYDPEALAEEYIPGQEVTVGILGEHALGTMEVVAKGEFHTYEVKYTPGREEFILPAPLPAEVERRVLELGLLAHGSLGCEGYSRVDARVTPAGEVFLIEVNTLPGLTTLSYLPKIAEYVGLGYADLVEEVLERASLKTPRDRL